MTATQTLIQNLMKVKKNDKGKPPENTTRTRVRKGYSLDLRRFISLEFQAFIIEFPGNYSKMHFEQFQ